MTPKSWFQIELAKVATIGRFKLGRDRKEGYRDRAVNYLKIEASADGHQWQTVFEKSDLAGLPDADPTKTMEIRVSPVEAKFVRVTVDPKNPNGDAMACIDEFEVYAPAGKPSAALPEIRFDDVPVPADLPRPQPPIDRHGLVTPAAGAVPAGTSPQRAEGGADPACRRHDDLCPLRHILPWSLAPGLRIRGRRGRRHRQAGRLAGCLQAAHCPPKAQRLGADHDQSRADQVRLHEHGPHAGNRRGPVLRQAGLPGLPPHEGCRLRRVGPGTDEAGDGLHAARTARPGLDRSQAMAHGLRLHRQRGQERPGALQFAALLGMLRLYRHDGPRCRKGPVRRRLHRPGEAD